MPETNPSTTPVLDGGISKIFNRIRSLHIKIKINEINIRELPFGWGEGEPPTPDDEEVDLDTK